jgi:hypothetical protein
MQDPESNLYKKQSEKSDTRIRKKSFRIHGTALSSKPLLTCKVSKRAPNLLDTESLDSGIGQPLLL